ncbi:MAG: hypothetical protein ABR953_01530 [Candidatus Acidiferrales bacterium]
MAIRTVAVGILLGVVVAPVVRAQGIRVEGMVRDASGAARPV